MTTREVLGSSTAAALVVNTASPSAVDHMSIVSCSPGNTGEAKRPSMCPKRAGSPDSQRTETRLRGSSRPVKTEDTCHAFVIPLRFQCWVSRTSTSNGECVR